MAQEQRWLTVDQVCTTLRLPQSTVLRLCKEGMLPYMNTSSRKPTTATMRVLDPTPEYQEKLRLAAIILFKKYPEIETVREKALFTRRELDLIVGWKLKTGDNYLSRNRIPAISVGYRKALYTADTIRKLLWKRSGRTLADGRSPIVLTELIEWFRKQEAAERDLVPTDAEFLADEKIQNKLGFIARMSDKDRRRAEKDFTYKAELAKRIVQILDSHGDGKCNSEEHSRANASL